MFDEPIDDPAARVIDPAARAREKADEFRIHAELAAVFEGPRKFDAQLVPGFDAKLARDIQKTMGKLERSRLDETPMLKAEVAEDAARLLDLPASRELSTNDYHLYRRPGEVMIVRWLAGEQIDTFYQRLQAHFDAGLQACRDEERQAQAWKQDAKTTAYLAALEAVEVKMAERYLRDLIRQHHLFVLSTQTADELNLTYLTDYIMGVAAEDIAGKPGAWRDGDDSPEQVWFYKLFSLRGMKDQTERMCFFAYLNRSEEIGENGEM